jgi:5-methyltetrahydrofolate--homocysteine methyltransferase
MIIIGELINGTRKAVKQAIADKDADFITSLAVKQSEAGASFIDCNPGTTGDAEITDIEWLVKLVQGVTELPIAFDTPNPLGLKRALEVYEGKATPMINSVTLEAERLDNTLPIIAESGVNCVALALGDDGMPCMAGQREATAKKLIEKLLESGVKASNIYLDPVIAPLSTDATVGQQIIQAIRAIRAEFPEVHITAGMSNISFGLPVRKLLNRVFMAICMTAGLDSAICDPLNADLMAEITAAEALLGRDEWCMNYITASRAGKLGE